MPDPNDPAISAIFPEFVMALIGVAIDAKLASGQPFDSEVIKTLNDSLAALREQVQRLVEWQKENGVPESSDPLFYQLHFLLSISPRLPARSPSALIES
jgi:hypothetical protein